MGLSLCVFSELGLLEFEIKGNYVKFTLIHGKTAKLVDSQWFRSFFR